MSPLSSSLKFFLNMAKVQAVMSRRFDSALNGISLNEFVILLHLDQAPGQKLRRVDLAEKIGLTASGVTRLLLPMEKIGLIQKEVNERDARVSFVLLAPGGKTKLEEGIERANLLSQELLPAEKTDNLEIFSSLLITLGGTIK